MNLQPISPPPRDGQRVYCVACGYLADRADIEGPAGSFYCVRCGARAAEKALDWMSAAREWLRAREFAHAATCARLVLSNRRGDAFRAGQSEDAGGPNPLISDSAALDALGLLHWGIE